MNLLLKFERLPVGLPNDRRDLVVLVDEDAVFVNAMETTNALSSVDHKKLLRAVDYWAKGHPQNKLHHGWDKNEAGGQYADCYVFKANRQRLYGYLLHADADNPRRQVCVLIHGTAKHERNTDKKILDGVRSRGEDPELKESLKTFLAKEKQG